jgi:hypothetical protein
MFSVKPVASNQRKPVIVPDLQYFFKPESPDPASALALLVLRIRADHEHDTAAANDLAIPADFLDRCLNFHFLTPRPWISKDR